MLEALGGYGEFVEKLDELGPHRACDEEWKTALVNVCTDPKAQATIDMGFAGC